MINPTIIPMRIAQFVAGGFVIYPLVYDEFYLAVAWYLVVFLPISMFCEWLEW